MVDRAPGCLREGVQQIGHELAVLLWHLPRLQTSDDRPLTVNQGKTAIEEIQLRLADATASHSSTRG